METLVCGANPSPEGGPAAIRAPRASVVAMRMRGKRRDLRVSALSGGQTGWEADDAPRHAPQITRSAAARRKVGTVSRPLCPS